MMENAAPERVTPKTLHYYGGRQEKTRVLKYMEHLTENSDGDAKIMHHKDVYFLNP